ncbi:hypothetical protein MTR_2g031830 [Medicago truncatula]|uniref:Uncharacterized protein n=1 Tax=Medicago truncatula TaxID=3880 RepID=A0A072V506_MEDTR|nr:hypothetical protein MTR_2g031830 [Medicago truncatula]
MISGFLSTADSSESCFFIPIDGFFGSPRELSRTKMVMKNWRATRRLKTINMDCGERWPMKIPPRRLPRTPPKEEAIQTNEWRLPEEDVIEAPKLLRRYIEITKAVYPSQQQTDMLDGEIAIASHDSACKKAA